MKTKLLLLIFFTLSLTTVFAQYTQNISAVPPLNRGVIITKDGKRIDFRGLHITNDTVIITMINLDQGKIPGQDVYRISRTGNYVLLSAVICGLSGTLGAITGSSNWDNSDLKSQKGSFILYSAIGSMIIGGIVGAFIHRDITVYKSAPRLSFNPGLSVDNNNRLYASIGVKLKL
jgi:hypothetical protein